MEKVAMCAKYRDREQTISWLKRVPQKYDLDTVENFLSLLEKNNYMLWTDEYGLKIL